MGGASLLTVHGRTKEEKGHFVAAVKRAVSIPVFANGGIETQADYQRALEETGCDGVLSAEGLLEDPALFSGRHVPMDTLVRRYLELARQYKEDQIVKMAKKHCFQFLYASLQVAEELRGKLGQAKTLEAMQEVADEIAGRREAEKIPERGWYRRHRKTTVVVPATGSAPEASEPVTAAPHGSAPESAAPPAVNAA